MSLQIRKVVETLVPLRGTVVDDSSFEKFTDRLEHSFRKKILSKKKGSFLCVKQVHWKSLTPPLPFSKVKRISIFVDIDLNSETERWYFMLCHDSDMGYLLDTV